MEVLFPPGSGTQISLRPPVLIYFPIGNVVTVSTGSCGWSLLIKQQEKLIIKQIKENSISSHSLFCPGQVGCGSIAQGFLVDLLSIFQSPRHLTTDTLEK